jgi:hypothetical protein
MVTSLSPKGVLSDQTLDTYVRGKDNDRSVAWSLKAHAGSSAVSDAGTESAATASVLTHDYPVSRGSDVAFLLNNIGMQFADYPTSLNNNLRLHLAEIEPDSMGYSNALHQSHSNVQFQGYGDEFRVGHPQSEPFYLPPPQLHESSLSIPHQQSFNQYLYTSEFMPSLTADLSSRDTESSNSYEIPLRERLEIPMTKDAKVLSKTMPGIPSPTADSKYEGLDIHQPATSVYSHLQTMNAELPHDSAANEMHLLPTTETTNDEMCEDTGKEEDESSEEMDSEDTESFWTSDYFDGTPELDTEHLLFNSFRGVIVERLLSAFCALTCTQNSGSGVRDRSNNEQTANAPTNELKSGEWPSKRKHHNGNEEDTNGGLQPSQKKSKTPKSENKRRLLLACPFRKIDSRTYQDCYKQNLTKISYVKQHLRRAKIHRIPIYCSVCMKTFDKEPDRDIHIRTRTCQERPMIHFEGVTEAQKRQLERRVSKKLSEEEQWYTIFDILFPGHPHPPSPYIDSELSEDLCAFQDFSTSHGPGILVETLRANGHNLDIQTQEGELSALNQRVLSDGLHAIFQQWLDARQPQFEMEAESDPPNHSGDNMENQDRRSSAETIVEEQETSDDTLSRPPRVHGGNDIEHSNHGDGFVPAVAVGGPLFADNQANNMDGIHDLPGAEWDFNFMNGVDFETLPNTSDDNPEPDTRYTPYTPGSASLENSNFL